MENERAATRRPAEIPTTPTRRAIRNRHARPVRSSLDPTMSDQDSTLLAPTLERRSHGKPRPKSGPPGPQCGRARRHQLRRHRRSHWRANADSRATMASTTTIGHQHARKDETYPVKTMTITTANRSCINLHERSSCSPPAADASAEGLRPGRPGHQRHPSCARYANALKVWERVVSDIAKRVGKKK